MILLVLALALLFGGGLAALLTGRRPKLSTALGTAGAVAGCAVGLWPAVKGLQDDVPQGLRLAWGSPTGDLLLGLDSLSAFFLLPVLLLGALGAIYGRGYLLAWADRKRLGPPMFFWNLLVASLVVVLISRGAVLFLVGWELMALTTFVLVTFDDQQQEARRAGWIYLVVAHIGVACLIAAFLLLDQHAHSLDFEAFRSLPPSSAGLGTVVFVLALVGFGAKAGFVPLHIWLPEAHAAAPSHVSALMSAVVLKVGLYGLLRFSTFLTPAPWWGPTLAVIGFTGALVGICLSLYQRDLKRVLAYSTIENVGIITLALGLAFWGQARGDWRVSALGAAGGLLHLWNHVLMKGLLFFCAGSVLHGSGTRDLEKLGGLMKRMPRTGGAMLLGAAAITGLPPLNGFVSEWLVYLGLIHGGMAKGGGDEVLWLLGVGLLALVGGLTALSFVRLTGIALLGNARSDAAGAAHESSRWLTFPMAVLAAGSVAMGLFPMAAVLQFSKVVRQVYGEQVAAQLEHGIGSLGLLGVINAGLWIAVALGGWGLWRLTRAPAPAVETWGCGYAAPTSRMQYTASSFSELLSEHLLPAWLRPRSRHELPGSFFPRTGRFESQLGDPLTRDVYEPFFSGWAERFSRLRFLQQGSLNAYVLYILVAMLAGLTWMYFVR